MRHLFLMTAVIIFGLSSAIVKEGKVDLVPSETVAIGIAVAVWNHQYGENHVDRFRPYHARLKGDYWHITGTVPKGTRGGGSPEAVLAKRDGQITKVSLAK